MSKWLFSCILIFILRIYFCFLIKVSDDGQNLPLPSQDIAKYQASIERNNDLEKITEEITEYYDSTDNIGISINYLAGKKLSTYSYYNTDELLLVQGRGFAKIFREKK